jgi:peptidoglycan/xylan/chitin deacetylase (PgdA/CDA1 family)
MLLIRKAKNKFIRIIREAFFTTAYVVSGSVPALVKQQKGLRVLVYHGVCKNDPHKFNARFLSEQQFEAHLIAIKKHYHVVSLNDLRANNLSASRLNVVLTFDDGLQNNYSRALPLLLKHKVPAVFFVCAMADRTAYLFNDVMDVFSFLGPATVNMDGVHFEKKKKWKHDRYISKDGHVLQDHFKNANAEERALLLQQVYAYVSKEKFEACKDYLAVMSEKELMELSKQNSISIGSHGIAHADLSTMPPGALTTELSTSRQYLEAMTGKPCTALAFPYGNYSAEVLTAAAACGYHDVFGTEKLNDPADRSLVIERFTVNPYVSAINQMYYIAAGNYA